MKCSLSDLHVFCFIEKWIVANAHPLQVNMTYLFSSVSRLGLPTYCDSSQSQSRTSWEDV